MAYYYSTHPVARFYQVLKSNKRRKAYQRCFFFERHCVWYLMISYSN
ncbi:hypothetical protein, no similarity [Geotrichum candidum]|uniref:Uncharacterized protein n=1 Tax=Geotrichum candidum TaxID=1173061 RepID=A0A0J9X7A5_GEOCN|nr:hypothetical protein, no similarity [Geotrichum candidum]